MQDAGSAPQGSGRKESDSPPLRRGGEASIEDFGHEAEGQEREEVLGVFTGYLGALAERDYQTACSHLSAGVSESLVRFAGKGSDDGCAKILPKFLAPTAASVARQQAEGEVTKVRVEDDRGFVVFKAPGAERYQLTMVEEDGEWKAATVATGVLVPEL
jgi:hypothetical protein